VLARDTLKLHGNSPLCPPFSEEHVARLGEVEERHTYAEPFVVEAGGTAYEVTLFNAGHIPGSAHVLVDDGNTRLLYTGDFHTDDQRLVSGTTDRPDADVVICESTYADVTHEDRRVVEDRWVERVRTTLWEGHRGRARVRDRADPGAHARRRGQRPDPYVDGMGVEVTRLVRRHPEFLRDPEALRRRRARARFVTGRDGQRKRIAGDNALIITTSGMLAGGPVHSYLPEIRSNPTNTVTLTGYQVEGTPGRELQERGRLAINGRCVPSALEWSRSTSQRTPTAGVGGVLESYRGRGCS